MAERIEITDEDSAHAWLETQDLQTQVWFAVRCALHALPAAGTWELATTSGLAFAISRAMLISAAAATCPPAEMSGLGDQAAKAVVRSEDSARAAQSKTYALSSANAARAAFSAANAARAAKAAIDATTLDSALLFAAARAASSATANAARAAVNATRAASNDTANAARATLPSAQVDATSPNTWAPLWTGVAQPATPKAGWEALKAQWAANEADWSFWIEWYEGILNGTPMDWDLIFRIATEITEEEWEAGQAVVAGRIENIKAQYLSEQAPRAETISLDPETGLFRVDPTELQNPPLIGTLLSRVRDALDDAVQGNNGINETSREVRVLGRTINTYGNDPQRIEMDFTSMAVSLRRQLHETRELPESEDNLALLEAVEEGVRGIRANHPEVAANRAQLAQQSIQELPDEGRELLAEAEHVLTAISQGPLREDFATDIPQLINDATLPLPSGAPPLPGADETTRIFGRVSDIARLYSTLTKSGAAAFDSDAVKTIRLVGGFGSILFGLVTLGLRLFGVL
ncbi:hypothetical protein [Roseobacter sp. S98]|uniref:hypothetical protein n=1 Tax=Roseobacter algicola (ex Choi et al. 2025) (nom. illeg.) TaxID=3092138 RepID=UPI003F519881